MSKRKRRQGTGRPTSPSLSAEAAAMLNAGAERHRHGDLEGAEILYSEVLDRHPAAPEALHLLGLVFHQRGHSQQALPLIERAISLRPREAQWHYNLGVTHHALGHLDEAIDAYQASLRIAPDNPACFNNMIHALIEAGHFDEAVALCERELRVRPTPALQMSSAKLLPMVMQSRESIAASRARFEAQVDALLASDIRLEDPLREAGFTSFLLAYHGEDDRPLHERVARLLAQASPSLLFTAPHCREPRGGGNRPLRIGFFSQFLFTHSITRCFAGIIRVCAKQPDIEATLFTIAGQPADTTSSELSGAVDGRVVRLSGGDLQAAREEVARHRLDGLIYLDIGMEIFGQLLAFARLAPLQCVMNGHPSTTGIPTIDCYLSMDLGEPDGAENQYSEELVRLEHGGVVFEEPARPTSPAPRETLGLPPDGHLFPVPVKLHKLHPDFDEGIARVLARCPDAHVVLFRDRTNPMLHRQLQARLNRTVPRDLAGRVHFIPWQRDPMDFMSCLMHATAVLDPFHFGAHSTSVLVAAAEVPLITMPGRFFRERVGMIHNTLFEQRELIAASSQEYAEIAGRICEQPDFRKHLCSHLRETRHAGYGQAAPGEEVADFLRSRLRV